MKTPTLLTALVAAFTLASCSSPSPCTNDCGPRHHRYEVDDAGYYPQPRLDVAYGSTAGYYGYYRHSSSRRTYYRPRYCTQSSCFVPRATYAGSPPLGGSTYVSTGSGQHTIVTATTRTTTTTSPGRRVVIEEK